MYSTAIPHPSPNPVITRPDPHYDCIVVGARAAGATTAMLLARQGLRVLAVDKSSLGSDTLSSHALMRGAMDSLASWGLLGQLWDAGTPVIRRTTFTYGTENVTVDIPGSAASPGLAAPRRTVLDPILARAAMSSGAHVLHDTQLRELMRDNTGRVVGVAMVLADGTHHAVTADLLIGADGLRSTVARHVGAPTTRRGDHASSYVLRYFTGLDVPTDEYRWLYGAGIGAGVIPTNNGAHCVFTGMRPSSFRAVGRRDPAGTHQGILHDLDPRLGAAALAATPTGPTRSWPGVRGQFRQATGPGWALVGDAGYFKDPYAAHGISDAFRDAALLSDAVRTGDFPGYESLRDDLSHELFGVLDHIASYDWDLTTLPDLHRGLSVAMRNEAKSLATLQMDGRAVLAA